MKRSQGLLVVAVLWISGAASVWACDGGGGMYSGLPWFGYGYSGSLYGLGQIPVPPYYALHPPVSYSHLESRPYGTSPFAAGWQSPTVRPVQPRLIVNPFVSRASLSSAWPSEDTPTSPSGIIVANPYYQPPAPGKPGPPEIVPLPKTQAAMP